MRSFGYMLRYYLTALYRSWYRSLGVTGGFDVGGAPEVTV